MLTLARKRLQKDEEDGFTLIELMVVVLIIAILLAIAIPTFLGAQDRARDRGAQSDLRNSVTAAKTIATDDAGLFTNVDMAKLATSEPNITFAAGVGSNTTVGFLKTTGVSPAPDTILFTKLSASGTAFGMGTASDGKNVNCKAAAVATIDTHAKCVTQAAAAGGTW